ncbi:biotin-dependent carboxyltransferase family protein [Alteribacter natronophilus]|uniref:5-oxoprolinase subunit C family protein n=1 Tax=Alteribacter natronophilus TaxID=2583810 RepID=UPI00110E92A7|nr:biotin-dependent carboxyltransferase family protein [Alteribacter natronophilus]TMW72080.1 biotin-dependent carboxyltransferase [Alteribacter natronophilus]
MSFTVEKPGLLTTVQDRGRQGYQQFGLSPAGAMDEYALQMANVLVGNERNEAVLEVTMMGPVLKAEKDMVIAFAGGNLQPAIDDEEVATWKSYHVRGGSKISFGRPVNGARLYLSVRGGIEIPEVMGSRSTYLKAGLGGFEGRELRKGDRIEVGEGAGSSEVHAGRRVASEHIPSYEKEITVRAVPGPQEDYFEKEALEQFFSEVFEVSHQSDRMGYRLQGEEPLKHKNGADILSDATAFGSVQVPGDGQPIILMADRQTTGGYTKIATVIGVDLWKVAQLPPGGKIRFKKTDVHEAQRLWQEQEDILVQVASYGRS